MKKQFAMTLGAIDTDSSRKNFYPTPESLAEKLMQDIDWHCVGSVLEPEAGKGDLALYAAKKLHYSRNRYPVHDERTLKEAIEHADIDCVEIDPFLRGQLESQGFRVVCDDFLNFQTQKRYDLIIMNPPFDRGAEHLLHALELIQHGGEVRCILNAETIRNGYTSERRRLLQALGDDAEITYHTGEFAAAERKTNVEVAIVRKVIPRKMPDSTLVENMREAPTYKEQEIPSDYAELVQYNQIDEFVNRYNFEVACGIKLIEEFEAMRNYLQAAAGTEKHEFFLSVSVQTYGGHTRDARINSYIRQVRGKYWRAIFQQKTFTDRLTGNLLNELQNSVHDLMDYDFSVYNILTLLVKMNGKVVKGIEDTIVSLFDNWTARTWNEESPNRHYYDGWTTNNCFAVGKKVIIPFYGAYDSWSKRFRTYNVMRTFQDIEKVFDFLDSGRTDWTGTLQAAFDEAESSQNTKNIDTKYFTVTFFKKGTAHLVFKDLDLLEKFNLFAGQRKGWLPPTYGKKRYADMSKEEKHVVDSFQGRERYEKVMANAEYYLDTNAKSPLMLGA